MGESPDVLLDLNNPVFQDDLLDLSKEDASRVLAALRKMRKMQWPQVYKDMRFLSLHVDHRTAYS